MAGPLHGFLAMSRFVLPGFSVSGCNASGRLIGNLFASHTVAQAFAETTFAVDLRSWQCLYMLEIPKTSFVCSAFDYLMRVLLFFVTWIGGFQVC